MVIDPLGKFLLSNIERVILYYNLLGILFTSKAD